MHRRRTALAACALLLLLSHGRALGLATEQFGNAPVMPGFPTFTADLLPLLNDPARVYWYEVNGDACFYYKGDAAALNAMLRRFAAGGKGREVVLHAGPLAKRSLGGERSVDAGWYLHVPGGISLSRYADGGLVTDTAPALHVHLPAARATAPADPARVAAWIKGLDVDAQMERDAASRELEKQGRAAAPALRKALETTPSAEVRKRARRLLAKLPDVDLDTLVIPGTLAAVGPTELKARCEKGLRSKEYVVRGVAATRLAELEPDRKKAVEGLLKVLRDDRHEYVRRSVAGALQREGRGARPALPELRKLVDDPDVNVRNAVRQAVEAIEKAPEVRGAGRDAGRTAKIQKDIAACLKARAAR